MVIYDFLFADPSLHQRSYQCYYTIINQYDKLKVFRLICHGTKLEDTRKYVFGNDQERWTFIAMIIGKILMNALPKKRKEVWQTLFSMIEPIRQEKECWACTIILSKFQGRWFERMKKDWRSVLMRNTLFHLMTCNITKIGSGLIGILRIRR